MKRKADVSFSVGELVKLVLVLFACVMFLIFITFGAGNIRKFLEEVCNKYPELPFCEVPSEYDFGIAGRSMEALKCGIQSVDKGTEQTCVSGMGVPSDADDDNGIGGSYNTILGFFTGFQIANINNAQSTDKAAEQAPEEVSLPVWETSEEEFNCWRCDDQTCSEDKEKGCPKICENDPSCIVVTGKVDEKGINSCKCTVRRPAQATISCSKGFKARCFENFKGYVTNPYTVAPVYQEYISHFLCSDEKNQCDGEILYGTDEAAVSKECEDRLYDYKKSKGLPASTAREDAANYKYLEDKGEYTKNCTVRNFRLPESYNEFFESSKDYIGTMGDPTFLAYYQNFPPGEDTDWSGMSAWFSNIGKIIMFSSCITSIMGPVISAGGKMIGKTVVSPLKAASGGRFVRFFLRMFSRNADEVVVLSEDALLIGEKEAASAGAKLLARDLSRKVATANLNMQLAKEMTEEEFSAALKATLSAEEKEGAQKLFAFFKGLGGKAAAAEAEIPPAAFTTSFVKLMSDDAAAAFMKKIAPTMKDKMLQGVKSLLTNPRFIKLTGITTMGAFAASRIDSQFGKFTDIRGSSLVLQATMNENPRKEYELGLESGTHYPDIVLKMPVILYTPGILSGRTISFYLASPCRADLKVERGYVRCHPYSYDQTSGIVICGDPAKTDPGGGVCGWEMNYRDAKYIGKVMVKKVDRCTDLSGKVYVGCTKAIDILQNKVIYLDANGESLIGYGIYDPECEEQSKVTLELVTGKIYFRYFSEGETGNMKGWQWKAPGCRDYENYSKSVTISECDRSMDAIINCLVWEDDGTNIYSIEGGIKCIRRNDEKMVLHHPDGQDIDVESKSDAVIAQMLDGCANIITSDFARVTPTWDTSKITEDEESEGLGMKDDEVKKMQIIYSEEAIPFQRESYSAYLYKKEQIYAIKSETEKSTTNVISENAGQSPVTITTVTLIVKLNDTARSISYMDGATSGVKLYSLGYSVKDSDGDGKIDSYFSNNCRMPAILVTPDQEPYKNSKEDNYCFQRKMSTVGDIGITVGIFAVDAAFTALISSRLSGTAGWAATAAVHCSLNYVQWRFVKGSSWPK